MTGLRYVYAVCRPFDAPLQAQLTGVGGAPVKMLAHHGLVAVVSSVPEGDFAEAPLREHLEDLDWLGATARAHQQVVDALTAVTTPLPLRLATVFRDDSGVRVMIEAGEEAFRRTLDRLDGRVEWGVKVYIEGGEEQAEAAAAPAAKPASGRDYLRQRRSRVQERRTSGVRRSGSPPGCTARWPGTPRTPVCTPRRTPRSPGVPGTTCSTRRTSCRAPTPRSSWSSSTTPRTRNPGCAWNSPARGRRIRSSTRRGPVRARRGRRATGTTHQGRPCDRRRTP